MPVRHKLGKDRHDVDIAGAGNHALAQGPRLRLPSPQEQGARSALQAYRIAEHAAGRSVASLRRPWAAMRAHRCRTSPVGAALADQLHQKIRPVPPPSARLWRDTASSPMLLVASSYGGWTMPQARIAASTVKGDWPRSTRLSAACNKIWISRSYSPMPDVVSTTASLFRRRARASPASRSPSVLWGPRITSTSRAVLAVKNCNASRGSVPAGNAPPASAAEDAPRAGPESRVGQCRPRRSSAPRRHSAAHRGFVLPAPRRVCRTAIASCTTART